MTASLRLLKKPASWLWLAVILALTGCGLPPDLVQQAEELHSLMLVRKTEVESSRQQLEQYKTSPEFAAFAKYAERENWGQHLDSAAQVIADAERLWDAEMQPELDQNSEYGWSTVQGLIEILTPKVTEARDLTDYWRQRADSLLAAKNGADQISQAAEASYGGIQAGYPPLEAEAARATKEFPEQRAAILNVITPLGGLRDASKKLIEDVRREYSSHASKGDADYAVLLQKTQQLEEAGAKFTQSSATLDAKFSELFESYSKTLTDMKADYGLNIRRQSWDESAEYPSMHDYDYPARTVDGPTFEYFDEVAGSLATFSAGWFGDSLTLLTGVEETQWKGLNIDPKENWNYSEDGDAEFWVESGQASYFHKYHLVQNGETSDSDWVPVEEELFFANIDNLGMDIETKPYGVFEDNKLTHAAPPGMAYVGNPRYGRWDSQGGGMMWTWIAPYLFYQSLFGSPYRYSRNEWNTWHGGYYGSRAYYGGTSSAPMYGTHSRTTQTSPALSGSNFGRSGGFSRSAGSVRGAGPSGRGGSFGGSGK